MKTYLLACLLGGLSLLTATAQDDRKLRNDHTYSTHNYKHPNKAAAARQWENKTGVTVQAPGFPKGPMTSYKQSVPGAVPTGGVVVPHTPDLTVARHNYKMPGGRLTRPAKQSASGVAGLVPSQSASEGNSKGQ